MRGGTAGVALKRGAGAGCNTPSAVKKVPRARLCGCAGASAIERTGAKHASVISSIAHHSARVRDLNIAVNLARCAGLDPDKLDEHATPELARERFGAARASFEQAGAASQAPRRWRDIWSAGHAVSGVTAVQPVAELIETTRQEYHDAMRRSLAQIEAAGTQVLKRP